MGNKKRESRDQSASGPKLALLGGGATLDLAGHLRASGVSLLDAEAPPQTAEAGFARRYGYRMYSARTGEAGCIKALAQIIRTAITGIVPANWIWTRLDGRVIDGLRPLIDPAGVTDADELIFLRRAHQAALTTVLREADEMILLLSGTACFVDPQDSTVYPFAAAAGTTLPAGAVLQEHLSDIAALEADFADLHQLLHALNPSLVLCLCLAPAPVAVTDTFSDRLPLLRQQSDLRVMMAHWAARHENVKYLPLWELCTGELSQTGQFDPVTGQLTPKGGQYIAHLFNGTDVPASTGAVTSSPAALASDDQAHKKARRLERKAKRAAKPASLVCEDELLEAFIE